MKKLLILKKGNAVVVTAVVVLLALMLTACGKTEFSLNYNSEKNLTVKAQRAEKDASFTGGTLEVADGEKVVITSDLSKGKIRVEIVRTPDTQSMDIFPNMEGEVVITIDAQDTDSISGTVPAGNYLIRSTCLENATGTIQVEAQPVS